MSFKVKVPERLYGLDPSLKKEKLKIEFVFSLFFAFYVYVSEIYVFFRACV